MGMDYDKSKKRKREEFDKDPAAEGDPQTTVTVHVHLGSRTFGEPLIVDEFKAFNTILDLKDSVLEKSKKLPWPPLDTDSRSMVSRQGRLLEDNETLASLFYPGCSDMTTYLFYLPAKVMEVHQQSIKVRRWLSIYEHGRFDKRERRAKLCKRLPFSNLSDPRINGQYKLFGPFYKPLLHTAFESASIALISASVILLAPTREIFDHLVSFTSKSKEYLVFRVSWDKLSYFFIRTLRKSKPDIPIVAVTDLDPHHLDLLTFLDTPPEEVPILYGWDFSMDIKEEAYATDMDYMDIKWVGLRHTDCKGHIHWEGDACPPRGFDEVIRMLRANPFLRRKKDWLEALDWLDAFRKSVSLYPPPASADPDPGFCYPCFGDDIIAKKLSEKDWV